MTEGRADGGEWVIDIRRHEPDGSPVAGADWDAAVLRSGGRSEPVEVAETGLGRYRVTLPVSPEDGQLSLRIHDRESDKLKVLHHSSAYPEEYRLGGSIVPELASLGGADEPVIETFQHKSVAHWFAFAAMASLLAGIVLRRI